jgi:hypothetical protein
MPAASKSPPVAFELLRQRLRQEGFPIGVDHQLALQELLDRIGPSATPANLKTLLCPIFAVNAAQQARFYEVFDEVFPIFHAVAPAVKPAGPEAQLAPPPPPLTWRERLAKRSWLFLAGALAVCGLIAAGIYHFQEVTPVVTQSGSPQTPPATDAAPASELHTRDYPVPDGLPSLHTDAKWHSVRWVLPVAPLLLFAAYWLFRKVRHRVFVDRQSNTGGPHFWPVQLEDATASIFAPGSVRQLARLMRRREEAPDLVLDVPATIGATLRGGGFPRFRYRPLRRPPEYLVFIERESAADHFAAMISGLMRLLQADGVFLNYYYFTGDPRRLTTEAGDEVWLADLAGRTPGNRALLFGPSSCILHPMTGRVENWVSAFERWPLRAMLVTDAPRGPRLGRLQEAGVCVCEASLGGLTEVINYFEAVSSGGSAAPPPFRPLASPPDEDEMDAEGDLRKWIAACAVYPELNWSLSLRLAKALDGAYPIEERASRLARASWFRGGEIPSPMREPMWNSLPDPARQSVQKTLAEMLHEQKPPSGSVAFESWRHALRMYQPAARTWQQRLRSLLPGPEDPVPAAGQRDLTLLRFLEWKPASRFSLPLTEHLRNLVFEHGLRTLGLRNPAWLTAAALASVMIVALLQPWKAGGADYLELAGEFSGGGATSLYAIGPEQTKIPIDATGGAFHTHIPADTQRLQVVSTLYPAPALDVKPGSVKVSVSPHRTTGDLNFVSLSETTPGQLVAAFEGTCSQAQVVFGTSITTVPCPVQAGGNFTPTQTGFIYRHDPKLAGEFIVGIQGPGSPVERRLKVGQSDTSAESPPEIVSLTAEVVPGMTRAGTRIEVKWTVRNGVDFWLDRSDRGTPPRLNAEQNNVTIATLAANVTLTLRVENGVGKAQKSVSVVTATPPRAAPSLSLSGPSTVAPGGTVSLKYSGKSVRGLSLLTKTDGRKPETKILRKPGTPAADVDDSVTVVNVAADTGYELVEEGGATASWLVKVEPYAPAPAPPVAPVISEFSSSEDKGGLVLTWRVTGAVSVTIVNSGGVTVANSKSLADSITVPPAKSAETYTLKAIGVAGATQKSLSVGASTGPRAPEIVIYYASSSRVADNYRGTLKMAGYDASVSQAKAVPSEDSVEYSAESDALLADAVAGLLKLRSTLNPRGQPHRITVWANMPAVPVASAQTITLSQIRIIKDGSIGSSGWAFEINGLTKDGRVIRLANLPAARYGDGSVVSPRIQIKVSSEVATLAINAIRGNPEKPTQVAAGRSPFPPAGGTASFTVRVQAGKASAGDFEFIFTLDTSRPKAAY